MEKYELLKEKLRALGSVAVAFSAGVDSTLLLYAAKEALGDRVIAVTASSYLFPQREFHEAKEFCEACGIEQIVVEAEELNIEGFRQNPKDRCYLCKKDLFTKIQAIAAEKGFACVAEGSNLDDTGDYRPGMQAVAELGIRSPLREAELTKAEIRELSEKKGLPTWDKPSFACLASRFVYGEEITEEKLSMVGQAEQRLLDLGFRQVRVRIHGTLARIEMEPREFEKLLSGDTAGEIDRYLRGLGFSYVTMDLGGYQTGSMNRTLPGQAG